MEDVKRSRIRESIKSKFLSTLEGQIDRYLEINHQRIIGAHYFSESSSQCIDLYCEGHFIAAHMMSHSVNEGIIKFVADRNKIAKCEHNEIISKFVAQNIITQEIADASMRIWNSYRNDIHHMNPKVSELNFQSLAKNNLLDLAKIETEIFGCEFKDGALSPNNPQYWDVASNGTAPVFLRLG